MTFEARELSIESGQPVLLAEFTLAGNIWRFGRADQDVTHGGNLYTGIPMKISEIVDSGEVGKNDVKLQVPRGNPIAEMWRVSPPSKTVGAVLIEIHAGETDEQIAWMGHVANVNWPDSTSAQIVLQSGILALEANGLRRLYQRGCPHVFGGPQCKKDLAAVTHAATITAAAGNGVTSPDFATGGPLAGGFLRWVNSIGVTDYRFVMSHGGSSVRIMTTSPDLVPGLVVDAVEGCNHTPVRCDQLGNIENYGGLPHFMKKNPFSGDPVF